MRDYSEIEQVFSKLIIEARPILTEQECNEITEYIDVDEYGLALRTAIAIYVEEKKTPTAGTIKLICELCELMSIDPKDLLKNLPEQLRIIGVRVKLT